MQDSTICQAPEATTPGVTPNIPARKRYTPYGADRNTLTFTNTDHQFLGQPKDTTGLNYLNNRYYDPATGVFTSVDPLVGKTGEPYVYAGGNPSRFVDSTGLSPEDACAEGSGNPGGACGVALAHAGICNSNGLIQCAYGRYTNSWSDSGKKTLAKGLGGDNISLASLGMTSTAAVGDLSGDLYGLAVDAYINYMERNDPNFWNHPDFRMMDKFWVKNLSTYDLLLAAGPAGLVDFGNLFAEVQAKKQTNVPTAPTPLKAYDPQCGCGSLPNTSDTLSAFFALPWPINLHTLEKFGLSNAITIGILPNIFTPEGFVVALSVGGLFTALHLASERFIDPDLPVDPSNACVDTAGVPEWPLRSGC